MLRGSSPGLVTRPLSLISVGRRSAGEPPGGEEVVVLPRERPRIRSNRFARYPRRRIVRSRLERAALTHVWQGKLLPNRRAALRSTKCLAAEAVFDEMPRRRRCVRRNAAPLGRRRVTNFPSRGRCALARVLASLGTSRSRPSCHDEARNSCSRYGVSGPAGQDRHRPECC
jgi:hypothetical protein